MPRTVISTLNDDGTEAMGPNTLVWHVPHNDIVNGSLLTVEPNQFAILKSRGAVIQVYETGQYPIQTTDQPILGGVQQAFYSGQSPWQYEVLYVNRGDLVRRFGDNALSRDFVRIHYQCHFFFHVESREHALALIQRIPINGHTLLVDDISAYLWPALQQDIYRFFGMLPYDEIQQKLPEVIGSIGSQEQAVLGRYGITLDDLRVNCWPDLSSITDRLAFRQLGLGVEEAFRYQLAAVLAGNSVVSAPNAAVGAPYQVNGVVQTADAGPGVGEPAPVEPPTTSTGPAQPS